METIAYKCINCGGPLQYSPAKLKFTCEYCRSDFTEAELKAHWGELDDNLKQEAVEEPETTPENQDDFSENTVIYSCQNCGAEIMAEKTTAATFCIYCHSPVVLTNRLTGHYKPDLVIPFKISEEDAKNKFFEMCRGKKFLPKKFLKNAELDMIKGVYYPYWLVDSLKDGRVDATAKTVHTWHEGDMRITETKTYRVMRAGKIDFKSFPHSALAKEDHNMMKYVNPYDDNEMKDFTMAYLSGFLAEKRDTERETAQPEVDKELVGYAKKIYGETMSQYDSYNIDKIDLRTLKENWKYALMPVWMMTFNYEGKNYLYSMNGQTGKTYGELPCDKGKLALFGVGIFVALMIIGIILGGYF